MPGLFDPDVLSSMSWEDLLKLRRQYPDLQNELSPYEHRAYARETVKADPKMALSIGASILPYQLYKMTGMSGARSAPSLDQVVQGYRGIWEGL